MVRLSRCKYVPEHLGNQAAQIRPAVPPAVTAWFLFLCLILTLAYPATSFYEILSHTVPSLIAGHSPTITLLLTVYCVLFTTLAVFSFVAGLKLWLVKPEAVRFARGGSGLI
jgi:hypothetical protein